MNIGRAYSAAIVLVCACGADSDPASADTGADADTDIQLGTPDEDSESSDAMDGDTADSPDVVDDDATVTYLYDPFGETITTLPDDAFTVSDERTATGLRLAIGEDLPWFSTLTGLARDGYGALDGLDGWGTNAAIAIVFDGPIGDVPSGFPASVESQALQLFALQEGRAHRVPFEVVRTEDGGLLIAPMLPLRPATRHGVIGTHALQAADGGAISPGPTLRTLLAGEAAGALEPMNERYAELLRQAGVAREDVAFAVPFTTQSTRAQSRAIAESIRSASYEWDDLPVCVAIGGASQCEGAFEASSWRDAGGVMGDGSIVRTYLLRVSSWIPDAAGPHPTAIFGHGLVHGRDAGGAMAEVLNPLGIAVVAIDAVTHGEHPDAPEDDALVLFEFFAVSLDPLGHNPRRLRDNFRQSTWDKLQLLRLLELDPDLDGDGAPDLDLDRMIYVGESFGGIMGVEFLALTDRFDAAVLQLGGGRVTSIISQARRFQAVRLLAGGATTPSETARFFPVVQAVTDPGDASTWAPVVLGERLPEIGGGPPHLLLQLVIDDDTIPDPSSDSLVRAFGLSQVPPVPRMVPMTDVLDPAPVRGNSPGGRTHGFFTFDRHRGGLDDAVEIATHDSMPGSVEAVHQLREFAASWLAGEVPVIVDPFEDLDTPELDDGMN